MISKIVTFLMLVSMTSVTLAQWPMSNDPAFDPSVANPVYQPSLGPSILLDGAHHNFFVEWDFIDPFIKLAQADGYRTVQGKEYFSPGYLEPFDMVMIITALPFEFTSKTEVTTEITFTDEEMAALSDWVSSGGALLIFSEHAPFDQAINPLLARFGLTSSVGTIADQEHYDKQLGHPGWVVYSRENGLLNPVHPITNGRDGSEVVNSVITFGGSFLSGSGYTNLFRLSRELWGRSKGTEYKARKGS